MEKNPVGSLVEALQLCSDNEVTVMAVFRCAFEKLPEDRREIIISQTAQAEQITLEDAEEKLRGTFLAMSMTNADPGMGSEALTLMLSESLGMQGQLASDVVRVEAMKRQEKKKEESPIIFPGR